MLRYLLASWLANLLQGELGVAYAQGRQPVADLIGGPLLRTVEDPELVVRGAARHPSACHYANEGEGPR